MAPAATAPVVDWQAVREKLAARRKELFEQLLQHPEEIRLAAEIRHLDDELVVCSDHLQRERRQMDSKGAPGTRSW